MAWFNLDDYDLDIEYRQKKMYIPEQSNKVKENKCNAYSYQISRGNLLYVKSNEVDPLETNEFND